MDSLSKFREFVNQSLHNPCNNKARIINGGLIFLIIISVTLVPIHFLPELGQNFQRNLYLFDRFVVSVFTAEYLLRFWSARYPVRYLTSWWGIIDLAAILPFYLSLMGFINTPEIFLLLRLLRILKFGKVYGMEQYAIESAKHHGHGEFHALPNEQIERVVQKHPLIFFAEVALPLLISSIGLLIIIFFEGAKIAVAISILFFAFAFLFFIKAWIDYNYDVIYITNRRVIVQNRQLFGSTSNDVAYEAITNVVPDNRGFWQWLLGIGDIKIETPAIEGILRFENVGKPHDVVHKISANRQKIHMAKERQVGSFSAAMKNVEKELAENTKETPT